MKTFLILFGLTLPMLSASQDKSTQQKAGGFTASFPWINNYSYYDYDLKKPASKSGFVGLGAGVYFKKNNYKFSVNTGITGDLPVPIGAFDYGKEGTRTNIFSHYWEVGFHRNLAGRINIIAGFNHIKYRFRFTSYIDSLPSYSVTDRTIGLTFGGEWLARKHSSIALVYRPTIFSLGNKQYRHLVSIDCRFDINIWTRN